MHLQCRRGQWDTWQSCLSCYFWADQISLPPSLPPAQFQPSHAYLCSTYLIGYFQALTGFLILLENIYLWRSDIGPDAWNMDLEARRSEPEAVGRSFCH